MAVGAVWSEPLSPLSPLTGKNTGIFRESDLKLSGRNGDIRVNTGDLSLTFLKQWLHKTGNQFLAIRELKLAVLGTTGLFSALNLVLPFPPILDSLFAQEDPSGCRC